MSATAAAVGPVSEGERWLALDVLRGLAIFGILTVNVLAFGSPARLPGYEAGAATRVDGLVDALLAFFVVGKFYTLFSLLFGVGFALQLARAQGRGVPFVAIYARRLAWLAVLGAMHAVLLWDGDILFLYAVLGFVLLLFRRTQPRTLLMAAAVCLAASYATMLVGDALQYRGVGPWSGPVLDRHAGMTAAEEAIAIYGGGSYAQIVAYRIAGLLRGAAVLFLEQGPTALAMFLLGLYAGREGLLARLPEQFGRLGGWGAGLVAAALVANAVFVYGELVVDRPVIAVGGLAVGGPLLCGVYVLAVVRILRSARWQRGLRGVAAVGRMALSNYLLQSLVCTTIFYGYGLGFYNQMGAAVTVMAACALYAAQLALSAYWMSRFRFGPAEWLWRSLTYGRRQPLRRYGPRWTGEATVCPKAGPR